MAIDEISNTPGQAAVAGINTTTGDGVWGQCDAGRGVVGVSKSGSGVWGETISGRAIVGANDEEGSGIWGETKKGRGVVGIVKTDGDGTWGQCDTGRGVVGVNKSGSGVWGETTSGRAVVGVSATDIGVFGKGGRFAGFFEGDVQVTGDLNVQGHSIRQLLQRIAELEASRVTRMGRPTQGPSTRPNIEVTELKKFGSDNVTFLVSGSAFGSSRHIIFSVFNNTTQSNVTLIGEINDINDIGNSTIIAHRNGTLVADRRFQIQGSVGDVLSFSATDGRVDSNDMTGLLWSNMVTIPVSS